MSLAIIPHTFWEPHGYPVTGNSPTPDQWQYNTLHWPGANVNVNDPIGALQSMQISWVNSKGYSLGYNFAVFPDGSVYEIRGFHIRCAANGSQEVNCPGIAILLAVPNVDTEPTDEMVISVQDLVAATRSQVPQSLIINGHRDVRPEPTQCPGEVIYGMICDDYFEPGESTPEPGPTPIGDDMAALGYYKDDRPGNDWQIWVVDIDAKGNVWTCPINDLPDRGKWDVVQPIVGDPPVRPFSTLVGLMDAQNRPGA
jgi:hypothetical protein